MSIHKFTELEIKGPFIERGVRANAKHFMNDTPKADAIFERFTAENPKPYFHEMLALARELERENAALRSPSGLVCDESRLNHLEELIRQCPHAEFDYCDDEAEGKPLGFSITLEGCETDVSVGATFREAIDEDMRLTLKRNSE